MRSALALLLAFSPVVNPEVLVDRFPVALGQGAQRATIVACGVAWSGKDLKDCKDCKDKSSPVLGP